MMSTPLVIAVDVGNTFVKFGAFSLDAGLAVPIDTLELETHASTFDQLAQWPVANDHHFTRRWILCSVHTAACDNLVDWLSSHGEDEITVLGHKDFRLPTNLTKPDQVGLDRLANSIAALQLRQPDHPAIIIDAGTAITVDVVSSDGVFLGGAILPGLRMLAHALADYTDRLPLVFIDVDHQPPAIGTSTADAIQSGLLWGVVGAISEIASRQQGELDSDAQYFLTGGDAVLLAQFFPRPAQVIPHLALTGIAATGQHDL